MGNTFTVFGERPGVPRMRDRRHKIRGLRPLSRCVGTELHWVMAGTATALERTRARVVHEFDTRSAPVAVCLYRRTRGRTTCLWRRRVLVSTTTGRRSGLQRTVPERAFLEGEDGLFQLRRDPERASVSTRSGTGVVTVRQRWRPQLAVATGAVSLSAVAVRQPAWCTSSEHCR